MPEKKGKSLGDLQLKGTPTPEESAEAPQEEIVLKKKLHEHVLESIQAAEELSDEDKKIAIDRINLMVEGNAVNVLDFDKVDLNLGSPLASLFTWKSTVEGPVFWSKVNASVKW
jgi:hypothetical protein